MRRFVALGMIATLAACSSDEPMAVPVVATVSVVAPSASVVAGSTLQLTGTPKTATGAVVAGRTLAYSSSNTAVATVNATSGLVQAVAVGTTKITAAVDSKTGSMDITVTAAPVNGIVIAPLAPSILTGTTKQFSDTLKNSSGAVLQNAGRTITWTSSDTSIATIDSTGKATARQKTGTTTITVTSESKTASTVLTVTPAPVGTVVLSQHTAASLVGDSTLLAPLVTVRDANNNVLTGRVVTYSSSDTAIASVAANGVVMAKAPGQATITVTSETKTDTIVFTVTHAAVASVTLSDSTTASGAYQIVVTLKDSGGQILNNAGYVITFESSDPGVAMVDANGVVTPVGSGTATITVTSEGKTATLVVTVQ